MVVVVVGGAPAWDGRRRTGRGDGFPETLRCSAINFPAPQSQMMMRHHPGLCGWWKIELWRGGDSHCLETRWTIPVLYLFVFATFGELLSNSCVKRPPGISAGGRDDCAMNSCVRKCTEYLIWPLVTFRLRRLKKGKLRISFRFLIIVPT